MTDPCDTVLCLKVLLVALPDRNMFLRNAPILIEPEHLELKVQKGGCSDVSGSGKWAVQEVERKDDLSAFLADQPFPFLWALSLFC